jgi:SpoVK/Ycf46/Vps4 family AAA+-type ATPase
VKDLNDKIKLVISAVADNDLQKAKQYVKLIIDDDKTQTNRYFCESIRRKLQASSMNLMELPHDVRDILHMEDVTVSFNEKRYYLSEREGKILDEVIGMYETSLKLSEMGIHYLNSLMLYGESGTGKTLFGKYIAYKLGLPFVYMNFSNAISSYLGSTSKNISKAFSFIDKQKCVFMVDEVDAIGMMRGKEDIGEMARITIALMQALDCVRNDTVIIGATNRIDMIDKALLRRFTLQHEVLKFSEQEMEQLISMYLEDIKFEYDKDKVRAFCKGKNCQASAINELIRAIAFSIRTGNKFELQ